MISNEVVQCFSDGKETTQYDRKNRYIELIVPIRKVMEEETQVVGVMLISASTEEIAASIDILEQKGMLILMIIMALVIGNNTGFSNRDCSFTKEVKPCV